MISFFNGLKTYGKKNQLKNKNALVIFLSVLRVMGIAFLFSNRKLLDKTISKMVIIATRRLFHILSIARLTSRTATRNKKI